MPLTPEWRTLNLDVPLVQTPALALPRFIILGVDGTQFATLLTLLSGFVIFLLRPGSVAARLLLPHRMSEPA